MAPISTTTMNDQPSSQFNEGFVNFDHANVCVPGLGSIHVKSRFPRLKPKYERKFVEKHDIEKLIANFTGWFNSHFDTTGREEYFKDMKLAIILFTVYINPIPELFSEEMDLCIKYIAVIWYIDDVLEDAIDNKVNFKILKRGNDQLSSILLGKYDNADGKFEEIPNYPHFGQLFTSLLEVHNICRKTVPGYDKNVKTFYDRVQSFFDVHRWSCVDEIDGRYSEESFRIFREKVAFYDGTVELVALLHGVKLSDEILTSPTLRRILDIGNALGAFANDLLGMKKEFGNGEKDNFVVFKVLQKNIPIGEAVQQICKLMETGLTDYNLLKEVIVQEFDYEENLVRYLEICDYILDGHNLMYAQSQRHRSVGSVTLTR